MGFLDTIMNGVKSFKEAAKAGSDFNPLLNEVLDELQKLHGEGKLDDVVFAAEEAYKNEHAEYLAKGAKTNADDSKNDMAALGHFMSALSSSQSLPADLKEKVAKLGNMEELMKKALGPLGNLVG